MRLGMPCRHVTCAVWCDCSSPGDTAAAGVPSHAKALWDIQLALSKALEAQRHHNTKQNRLLARRLAATLQKVGDATHAQELTSFFP